MDRRVRFLVLVGSLAILLAALWALSPRGEAQALKREKAVVGYLPFTVAQVTTNEFMKKHGTFEKFAKQFGYDLEVEWKQFPTGQAVYEGLGPGHVHFGAVGAAPTSFAISRGSPVYIISLSEGHLEFALLVPNDSPIHSLDDLVNKKASIGVPVGSDAHRFLQNLWHETYGKSLEETGVTAVNMNPADIYLMPKGVDAVAIWNPGPVIIEDVRKRGKRLINSYGITGSANEMGPGKIFPSVKKHWSYPEGYILHRTIEVVYRGFAEKHPDLVTAFLMAQQDAVRHLAKDKRMAWETSNQYWKMDYDVALKMLNADVIIGYRDWIWETEADLAAIVYGSRFLYKANLIPRPVTWDDIAAYTRPVLPAVKKAYELSGSYPSLETFADKNAQDLRGIPVWMPDKFEPDRWRAKGLGYPNPMQ